MKTIKAITVSALTIISIIACGGMKVDLAPNANAQEEQKPDVLEPSKCECSGEVGPEGPMGPQGPVGEQGARGSRGEQGLPGPAGEQGPVGPQGPVGAQGVEGPRGVQGPEGERGEQGSVGPRGPQGEQGPEGPQGPAVSPGNVYLTESVHVFDNLNSGEILRKLPCDHVGDIPLSGGCKVTVASNDASSRIIGSMPGMDGPNNTWDCTLQKSVGTNVTLLVRALCLSAQ